MLLDLTIEQSAVVATTWPSVGTAGSAVSRDFSEEVSRPLGALDPVVAYRPTQALTAHMRDAIAGLDGIVTSRRVPAVTAAPCSSPTHNALRMSTVRRACAWS